MPLNECVCMPTVCIWSTEIFHYEMEMDDDNMANTALTFVFLFLITLFYSIGVTVFKVRPDPINISRVNSGILRQTNKKSIMQIFLLGYILSQTNLEIFYFFLIMSHCYCKK